MHGGAQVVRDQAGMQACLGSYARQFTEGLRSLPVGDVPQAVQPLATSTRLGQQGLHCASNELCPTGA